VSCEDRPPLVSSIDEVLRQRGSGWEVITTHVALAELLREGGDYECWITEDDPDVDVAASGGGNASWWDRVDPETIEVRFQWGSPSGDPVRIPVDILRDVIERLAASRHVREKYRRSAADWDRHHRAWLIDRRSCPADATRKNCSNATHVQWEESRPERQRLRAERAARHHRSRSARRDPS
jgi:hypothetical protein